MEDRGREVVEHRAAWRTPILLCGLRLLRITGGMVDEFKQGEIVPVFDEPPAPDPNLIRTEADFDFEELAREVRHLQELGRTEEEIRERLRGQASIYAEAEFTPRTDWLLTEYAEAFVEMGEAEWISEEQALQEALEAWQKPSSG